MSPKDRETPRIPFTRQRETKPPAASTRAASDGTDGVWSCVIAIALPARQSTARQSPTFATCKNTGCACSGGTAVTAGELPPSLEKRKEEKEMSWYGKDGWTAPGRWTIAITATAPEKSCSVICFLSVVAVEASCSYRGDGAVGVAKVQQFCAVSGLWVVGHRTYLLYFHCRDTI